MLFDLVRAFAGLLILSSAAAGLYLDKSAEVAVRDLKSFTVPRIKNPDYVRNGTKALLHAFYKHGLPVIAALGSPQNSTLALHGLFSSPESASSARVQSVPQPYGAEYLSPIQIGTPPQTLHLDLDTGSSDFWVFSGLQPANQLGTRHGVFRILQSSTFKFLAGQSWTITYGDNSAAGGSVGTDVVTLGALTVQKQAVEVAKSVSDMFVRDLASDGILGLGFNSINNVKPQSQLGLFDNLKPQLDQPVFTVDLKEDGSGDFTFGSISNYHGDVNFVHVDPSKGFWTIVSPSYSIGGKEVRRSNASPMIADTGTSLLIVDEEVAKAFYNAVPESKYSSFDGGYIFPCDAQLPSFAIAVGDPNVAGKLVTIPERLLIYQELNDAQGNCFGSVQGNSGAGMAIAGDILFRSIFAVFDGTTGKPRFGFVAKNDG